MAMARRAAGVTYSPFSSAAKVPDGAPTLFLSQDSRSIIAGRVLGRSELAAQGRWVNTSRPIPTSLGFCKPNREVRSREDMGRMAVGSAHGILEKQPT